MSDIKPGDVVRLKSGSPRMTVAATDGTAASCEWFDDKKVSQSKDFLLVTLDKDE